MPAWFRPTTVWVLLRPDGTPYGTFIHFDLEPRSIAADEIDFLRETVPLFMKQLA
jgi:hypothetical protein